VETSTQDNENNGNVKTSLASDIQIPLALTLTTGIITTLLGYIYSKFMKLGFRLVWKTIPTHLLNNSGDTLAVSNALVKILRQYPPLYIILMAICGGAAVACVSSNLPSMYSAHDYVHILSNDNDNDNALVNGEDEEKDVFPSARGILPVMGLCLLTSLSGFSLGPEAPMVRTMCY
jgi:H+/Cl- antiporter ClcA